MISKIRNYLKSIGADALYVPHDDDFLSEHVTSPNERLRALTGFTGSAGIALVTMNKAILFTDSRYTEQAKRETSFIVIDVASSRPSDWIKENLVARKIICHAGTISAASVLKMRELLQPESIVFDPISDNPVDLFWKGRPRPKTAKESNYSIAYAGSSCAEKTGRVAEQIRAHGLDAFLLSDPASVSWLLNKRVFSHPQFPVVLKRVLVTRDGKIHPVSFPSSLTKDDREYGSLNNSLLSKIQGEKIGADPASVPFDLYQFLGSRTTLVPSPDISLPLRVQKNAVEIKNIKSACAFESVALCELLAWIDENKNKTDELSVERHLKRLRMKNKHYLGDSFDAIVAVGAHACLAHYRSIPKTNVKLSTAPMVLIDTGGQYLTGTTDMTRTIAISKPTPLMVKRYTQVLRGHIALAMTTLKPGMPPKLMDENARRFLRADGSDYGHSTGHGIGMCLSVHESPPNIHSKSANAMRPNMVFSNEPGYYDLKNRFGIRLENMLLSVEQGKNLAFENLIFVPFDPKLIDVKQLTFPEKRWLATYHTQIQTLIFPKLSLKTRTYIQPIIDFFTHL